eukprot:m.165173 g.165173  ORF g.165173 m.165173 type:complete len:394 (-) comp17734_c0_seq2:345-1526(-)
MAALWWWWRWAAFAVVVAVVLGPVVPCKANLTLELFGDEFPNAVCNDGSSGGVYFKPAAPGGGHLWLLWLQGGGWCYDEKTCSDRWKTSKHLMSSKGWESSIAKTGIFSPDPKHSPLALANKAFLPYCTSDGHMGNRSASSETFGWQFRGQETVIAALKTLVSHGMKPGDTVVFGGSSAGGRGAMVTCDFLGDFLPTDNILCAPDSPYWIDMTPMPSTGFPGLAYTTKQVYTLANAQARAPASCKAMFPGEEWKCLFGFYRMPLLKRPFLMYASQSDAFQLAEDVGHKPTTSSELEYAAVFGNTTRSGVKGLLAQSSAPLRAVFSSNCFNHAVSETDLFFQSETVVHTSMAQALEQCLQHMPNVTSRPGAMPVTLDWVDTCVTFNCGPGCPGN